MKNSFKNLKKQKKGFTLIETLVAIAILITSVIGPLSIAYQGVSLSLLARDQITASFLAQEGLEFVRFRIGTNNNLGEAGNGLIDPALGVSSYSLLECSAYGGHYCIVDPFQTNLGLAIFSCDPYSGGVCPYLKYDQGTGRYNYTTGQDTNFRRSIIIKYDNSDPSPTEFQVESRVDWGKPGDFHSVILKEVIMDWPV